MIDTPRIIQTTTQLTAMIHLVIPRLEIQKVMEPCLQEIKPHWPSRNSRHGALVHAHTCGWITSVRFRDLSAGEDPYQTRGPRPTGQHPRSQGSSDDIPWPVRGSWQCVGRAPEWVSGQGLKPALDLWEVYAAGPESGPDSQSLAYRIEANRFCLSLARGF